MTRRKQNVTTHRSTTPKLQFTVTDDSGAEKDLSAATLTWKLSDKSASSSAHATVTNMTISGTGNNVASFTLTTSNTDLDAGRYYHELRANDGTYDVVVATGEFIILASNTA